MNIQDKFKFAVEKWRDDPKQFIEKCFFIETSNQRIKDFFPNEEIKPLRGQIYPFKFTDGQNLIYNNYLKQCKAGKPVRQIILKPRQEGGSTCATALVFATTILNPNTYSLIIANLESSSIRLFNMVKLFLNELPFPQKYKPQVKTESKRKIVFDNKEGTGLHSEIRIDVSANKDAGRSATLQCFLGSEVSSWFYPEEVMLSVAQTIPDEPNTLKILESTAKGFGTYFHQQWLLAKEKAIDMEPIFIAWTQCKAYKRKLDERWFDVLLDSEERYKPEIELKKQYRLTDEQLYWRRYTIDNKCQGNPLKFCQEYPIIDVEAFISVAMNVFDVRKLQEIYYSLAHVNDEKGDIKDGRFQSCGDGYWTLWEKPEIDVAYIMGLDSGTGSEGGNPSVAIVLRADTLDQVGELVCHLPPTEFAKLAVEGAKYFNEAFLNPEITGCGLAVIEQIKALNYYNIYRWERADEYRKKITNKLGFETNIWSKNLLVNDIRDYINYDSGKIRSKVLINEMMNFLEYPDGKMGAGTGCNDDRVIAFGLTLRAWKSHQRQWEKPIRQKQEIPTIDFYENRIEIPYQKRINSSPKQLWTPYGVINV